MWRGWNLGATKPEEYGRYFGWGDVVGQTWNGSSWSGGGFASYPEYEVEPDGNLKPAYDAAHVILGGKWRMPTQMEQQELIDNCNCEWTDNFAGTGVCGRIFTSKVKGFTDKSIFLPAAGYGDHSTIYSVGSIGNYWSKTFDFESLAGSIYLCSPIVYTFSVNRDYGLTIRPVSDK